MELSIYHWVNAQFGFAEFHQYHVKQVSSTQYGVNQWVCPIPEDSLYPN